MSKTLGLIILATLFANPLNLFSAEDDGAYLLNFDAVFTVELDMPQLSRLPLKVYLDRKDGKFRGGFAVGAMRLSSPCTEVDGSGLTLEKGLLKGPLKIGALKTDNVDPVGNETWLVDARMEGDTGKGTYTHSVRADKKAAKRSDQQDSLTIEREAPAPYPSTIRIEMLIEDGINPNIEKQLLLKGHQEVPFYRDIFLQIVLTNGKVTGGSTYTLAFNQPPHAHETYEFLSIPRQMEMSVDDGTIKGTMELDAPLRSGKEVYNLTLTGRAIGGRTVGKVALKSGEKSWESQFSGRIIRSVYQPPLVWKENTWTYEQLPADPNLVALAKAESLVAVRPGEPGAEPGEIPANLRKPKYGWAHLIEPGAEVVSGKRWFGSWTGVLRGVHSTISAPTYGFRERAGAVKYQFVVAEQPYIPIIKVTPLTGVTLPKEVPIQVWDGTKTQPEKWMGELPEWSQRWMPLISPPKKVYYFSRQKWDYLNQNPKDQERDEAEYKLLPKTWVPTEEEWGIPGVTLSGLPWVTRLYPIADKDVLPNGKGLILANLLPEIPEKYKYDKAKPHAPFIGGHQWVWKRKIHAFLSVTAPMFVTGGPGMIYGSCRLNGSELINGQIVELENGIYDFDVDMEDCRPGPRQSSNPDLWVPTLKTVSQEHVARYRKDMADNLARAISFEADKPWRPLTPIWDKLPDGIHSFSILPFDKDGSILPGSLDLEIADRDGMKMNNKLTTIPRAHFSIEKKTCFQGPYFKPLRTFDEATLKAARFLCNYPTTWTTPLKEMKYFDALDYSGEGVMYFGVQQVFYSALYGSLVTKDPMEKKEWQEMSEFAGDCLRLHTSCNASGLGHCYADYTFMNYFIGNGFLNLYQHTKTEKWKVAAEKLAQAFVNCQMPSGSWNAVGYYGNWGGMQTNSVIGYPPENFHGESCMEFDPSGVVRFLGRVRHDLKTDKFWAAEKKAYDYAMSHSVRQMLWVKQGHHSWDWAFNPTPTTHGVQAQQFCGYLLDYAKPEQKDLKLVEDLMRWVEDLSVHWDRKNTTAAGVHQVFPYVDGGRGGGCSPYNNLEIAIIYLKLYRNTKNPLHKAKAEALANAVLIAQDAEHGSINPELKTSTGFKPYGEGPGWEKDLTVGLLYDYGQLLKQIESEQ